MFIDLCQGPRWPYRCFYLCKLWKPEIWCTVVMLSICLGCWVPRRGTHFIAQISFNKLWSGTFRTHAEGNREVLHFRGRAPQKGTLQLELLMWAGDESNLTQLGDGALRLSDAPRCSLICPHWCAMFLVSLKLKKQDTCKLDTVSKPLYLEWVSCRCHKVLPCVFVLSDSLLLMELDHLHLHLKWLVL